MAGDVRTIDDVTYRERSDRDLELDLYLPPDEGIDRPAVVLVHGGGWETDHRGMFASHLTALARDGIAGVGVTHRLSGEAPFSAAVSDVKAAIGWLRRESSRYGIDPDRIAVGGHSSGAHLGALAAVTPGVAELEPDDTDLQRTTEVQGAILMNGPYNLSKLGQTEPSRLFISGFLRRFMGGPYADRPERYRRASVTEHLSEYAPPLLILTGTSDEEVSFSESAQLYEPARKHGIPVELEIAKGGDHLAFLPGNSHYEQGLTAIRDFLGDVLVEDTE